MGGLFLALLLVPVATGIVGYVYVKPRTSWQGYLAVGSSLVVATSIVWLALRYDESGVEVVIAAIVIALGVLGLLLTRRASSAARLAE